MKNEEELNTDVQDDKTSDESQDESTNDQGEDSKNSNNSDVATLTAQKNKWKEKAVDPETGKTYKELFTESRKKPKSESETPKNEEQPETDYGKLAYLNSKGIDHQDDQKIVMDEAKRLDLPIEKVLEEKHIQNKLQDVRNQRSAEDGMPKGSGNSSGGNKSSVDYWVNRKDKEGNYMTPKDTKLANEVINARIKSEESSNMFSDELYTG